MRRLPAAARGKRLHPHGSPCLTAAPRTRPARAGGAWEQRTSYAELDLSAAATLASFLQSGLAAFPPSTSSDLDRKYGLIMWDHGSGWAGFGIDSTCSPLKPYNERGCGMLSMPAVSKGARAVLSRAR
jgi:hypothetical protein